MGEKEEDYVKKKFVVIFVRGFGYHFLVYLRLKCEGKKCYYYFSFINLPSLQIGGAGCGGVGGRDGGMCERIFSSPPHLRLLQRQG